MRSEKADLLLAINRNEETLARLKAKHHRMRQALAEVLAAFRPLVLVSGDRLSLRYSYPTEAEWIALMNDLEVAEAERDRLAALRQQRRL